MNTGFIYVDTSGWMAYFNKSEGNHRKAVAFIKESPAPLITSNYVVDELITLLTLRAGHKIAVMCAEALWAEKNR